MLVVVVQNNQQREVKFVKDWHKHFVSRAYTVKKNHVSRDQIWIQKIPNPFVRQQ